MHPDFKTLENHLKDNSKTIFYNAIPSNLETRNQAGHTIMHLAAQHGDMVALNQIFNAPLALFLHKIVVVCA